MADTEAAAAGEDEGKMMEAPPQEVKAGNDGFIPSSEDMVDLMLQAKNDRKRAESDVQLLANRLAHLKAEQRKAEKKIQETEKRAGDIRKMKVRNVENARRKEATKTYGSREQQKNQQMLAMERAKEREKKRQQRLKTTKSKQVVVASQKEDKLKMMRSIAEQQADEVEKKRKLKLAIKKREDELKAQRQREAEARRKKQLLLYKKRWEQEKARADEADQTIGLMEQEEMKLIEALRKTQERQRAAYEKLESALTSEDGADGGAAGGNGGK